MATLGQFANEFQYTGATDIYDDTPEERAGDAPEDLDAMLASAQQDDDPADQVLSMDQLRHFSTLGQGSLARAEERNNESKTGPKGVLADYKQAQLRLRANRIKDAIARSRNIDRQAGGHQQLNNTPNAQKKKSGGGGSDSELDSEDEAFLQYRMDRISLIQDSMPQFGQVLTLGAGQIAHELDALPTTVPVVLHLLKDYVPECVKLQFSLRAIAAQFPYTKFMEVWSTDLLPDYDDIGLPTVIGFQGSHQTQNFVKVTQHLPKDFTDQDVVAFLKKHAMIFDHQTIEHALKQQVKREKTHTQGKTGSGDVQFRRRRDDDDEDSSDGDW